MGCYGSCIDFCCDFFVGEMAQSISMTDSNLADKQSSRNIYITYEMRDIT
jgi:hypothetical protein